VTLPGAMNGDNSTEPVRPPPGPVMPGSGVLGPVGSAQHADASAMPLTASASS
jgi:hypothetical protein